MFNIRPYKDTRTFPSNSKAKDKKSLYYKLAMEYYEPGVKRENKSKLLDKRKALFEMLTTETMKDFEETRGEMSERRHLLNEVYLEGLKAAEKGEKGGRIAFVKMLEVFSYRLVSKTLFLGYKVMEERRALKEELTSFISLERVAGFIYNLRLKKTLATKHGVTSTFAASFITPQQPSKSKVTGSVPEEELTSGHNRSEASRPRRMFTRSKAEPRRDIDKREGRKVTRRQTSQLPDELEMVPEPSERPAQPSTVEDATEALLEGSVWSTN